MQEAKLDVKKKSDAETEQILSRRTKAKDGQGAKDNFMYYCPFCYGITR